MNEEYEPPMPLELGFDWWGFGAAVMVGGAVALAWAGIAWSRS